MKGCGIRLALGTAQFGSAYGLANRSGRVERDEVKGALVSAAEAGIDTLDTAVAYGESEEILGQFCVSGWKVVTKLPEIRDDTKDLPRWVEEQVDASLRRLRVERLYGLLLHRPEQLLQDNGGQLAGALESVKASGKTRKIGISIYNPEQLGELLPKMSVDLVQAPLNVFDSRLIKTGWCARLKDAGIEVHARSVFLQGLLLMKERPQKFRRWDTLWENWDCWLRESRLTPLQACLRYVLSCDGIDKVIVGVDSASHLREIIAASAGTAVNPPPWRTPVPAELIDPSCWASL
jgi:aryl-alcohol dehydrogenase-like predicted oxidoreductase